LGLSYDDEGGGGDGDAGDGEDNGDGMIMMKTDDRDDA
jgi:hypothetical protein